jgi:predicted PurR-regulated permease PerM
MSSTPQLSLDRIWKSLLILTLLFFGLTQASDIIIPLVFSLFLAILLNPVVSFMENKGMNSILAIIISMILVSIVLSAAVYYVSFQAKNLIVDLPGLVSKFNQYIDETAERLNGFYGFSTQDQLQLVKQNSDKIISSGSSILSNALTATSNVITFISLIPIYVFFILLYRSNFKKFLSRLSERNNSNFLSIAGEVNAMVHSYIVGLLIVITIIAVLNIVGLLALGIKYAVFLGILSAALTVIPYIGIIIGAALPVLVALITKDSLLYPLGVMAIFAFVQFLEGNFITPNIIGSKVNVNPLAAIVALIIGGKIWGIIGMIMAIPMCGILKIMFSHYPRLKPYAILLQSTNKDDEEKSMEALKEKLKRKKEKASKKVE